MNNKREITTLAGGCFWCTEALFKKIKGIKHIIPGYSGGTIENPSYEQVCSGLTGHAESVQIQFDPMTISFERILDIFWHTHDPTTLNRQGNDIGTQYRSAIFYHNEKQREVAERLKNNLQKEFKDPIVTEITYYKNFYPAENYHKDYYERNKETPYCDFVIYPKLKKLFKSYKDDIEE